MTSFDIALTVPDPSHDHAFQRVIALAVDGVDSANTKRIYRHALVEFLDWHEALGRPPLTKAHVQAYKAHLQSRGLASSSINVKLSAVRRLVREAADNNLIDEQSAQAIARVKGVKTEGQRLGNWLDLKAAQRLLNVPDSGSLRGLRDRALLAVMLGAALRREEAANLTVEHLQQREARWVIVDLQGKRGKVRSIPIPSWVKLAVDAWTAVAHIDLPPGN